MLDRIKVDPGICEGRPTIRGLRITVEFVLKLLGDGYTAADIVREYPELEEEDVYQAARRSSSTSSSLGAVTRSWTRRPSSAACGASCRPRSSGSRSRSTWRCRPHRSMVAALREVTDAWRGWGLEGLGARYRADRDWAGGEEARRGGAEGRRTARVISGRCTRCRPGSGSSRPTAEAATSAARGRRRGKAP